MIDKILPCPFCNFDKIDILEQHAKSPSFGDCLIFFCRCQFCGGQGPWSYNIGKNDEGNSVIAIENWNKRDKMYVRENDG